jgi:hypothetical protein
VFDRRRHRVFAIDAARTATRTLVEIGHETGRVLRPTAFDAALDGTFIVADAPGRQPRVSVFERDGQLLNYFTLTGTDLPRITVDNLVLNGIGAVRYSGVTVLLNQPEQGALVSEYSVTGAAQRSFGALRRTGFENNPEVHLAFNTVIPLPAPDGAVFVVFLAGQPAFRKYARTGELLYERSIQGIELDSLLLAQPTLAAAPRGRRQLSAGDTRRAYGGGGS